jgi:AraC-like DNA-binding protein
MLEKSLYLLTGFCGFIILTLFCFRYKKNRNTNLYFIVFLFLSNIRFVAHGLSSQIPFFAHYLKPIELLFVNNAWPLLYLYFKKLTINPNNLNKKNLFHFVAPFVICFLYLNKIYFIEDGIIIGYKIAFIFCVILSLTYSIVIYKLLRDTVWKRKSDIYLINQHNNAIKKWSKVLFTLFVLMLLRFLVNLTINNSQTWYLNNNNYLWVGAVIWIALYIKILYSPEFLYGYEVFESKMKEYNKHSIFFDNIWITKTTKEITNIQDLVLKEKIASNIETYILDIERLALGSDIFLNVNFKPIDLAIKLAIPKSHVIYVFKYHSKISFADFRKIIRIQKTILLIEEGYLKTNTMESLSEITGFISYSNFFKSFKSIKGVSPQVYIRN